MEEITKALEHLEKESDKIVAECAELAEKFQKSIQEEESSLDVYMKAKRFVESFGKLYEHHGKIIESELMLKSVRDGKSYYI